MAKSKKTPVKKNKVRPATRKEERYQNAYGNKWKAEDPGGGSHPSK